VPQRKTSIDIKTTTSFSSNSRFQRPVLYQQTCFINYDLFGNYPTKPS